MFLNLTAAVASGIEGPMGPYLPSYLTTLPAYLPTPSLPSPPSSLLPSTYLPTSVPTYLQTYLRTYEPGHACHLFVLVLFNYLCNV